MKIAIVGPGRLGRSLAVLLQQVGHHAVLVGRDLAVPDDADLRLLTVPDGAIAQVARALPAGPVLLHCSGAQPVEVLRPHSPAGSWHPLMTFPGPEVDVPVLTGVAAAIAGDPEAQELAALLATDLGMRPVEVPGDRRLYHASAVIAGNLATVLLGEASKLLQAAGVAPSDALAMLAPLAERSVANASHGIARSLTGPLARGDTDTLEAHRRAMEEHGFHDVRALFDQLVCLAELHLGHAEAEEEGEG
ncbi:MAG: DUF2520 domain-containing protein [Myxococcales bacterium]|nr:DUF2520 domain-containing protein [Myxococcales bacterium]